ncbi:MAG TPA: hypothetical protein VKR06_23755 [Ktedonosporobacter sp.]|nr:hypothetical protein [Ktedonosporobacter sp.]
MHILTFLITLTVVAVMIASGVLLNSYLFAHGAFGEGHLAASRRLRSTTYDIGYSRLGKTDKRMSDYVRKSIFVFLLTIFALLALVAITISSLH